MTQQLFLVYSMTLASLFSNSEYFLSPDPREPCLAVFAPTEHILHLHRTSYCECSLQL